MSSLATPLPVAPAAISLDLPPAHLLCVQPDQMLHTAPHAPTLSLMVFVMLFVMMDMS
jgi:hypothetical protein